MMSLTRDNIRRAIAALASRPMDPPLTFVAYGDRMEADAREMFAGTAVRIIRATALGVQVERVGLEDFYRDPNAA